jgi:hypothetical protein
MVDWDRNAPENEDVYRNMIELRFFFLLDCSPEGADSIVTEDLDWKDAVDILSQN